MKVSKNIYRGGIITDLFEIKRLAKEKKSVVLCLGFDKYCVRPAAFILGWPLFLIFKHKLYYSVKESDITEVEFET